MGFIYDELGLTYEGAAVASVLVTFAVIGAGKLIVEGKKYLYRKHIARIVRKELVKPENADILRYLQQGK
jgi:hypothetical protein